jgi:hypothetical protein
MENFMYVTNVDIKMGRENAITLQAGKRERSLVIVNLTQEDIFSDVSFDAKVVYHKAGNHFFVFLNRNLDYSYIDRFLYLFIGVGAREYRFRADKPPIITEYSIFNGIYGKNVCCVSLLHPKDIVEEYIKGENDINSHTMYVCEHEQFNTFPYEEAMNIKREIEDLKGYWHFNLTL